MINKLFDLSTIDLPKDILQLIEGPVFDFSSSPQALVLYVQEKDLFIKISKSYSLHQEAVMISFLNRFGIAPRVYSYVNSDKDYLVTHRYAGIPATYFKELYMYSGKEGNEKLAKILAKGLLKIHSLPAKGSPYMNLLSNRKATIEATVIKNHVDMDLLSYLGYKSYQPALDFLNEHWHHINESTLIHGDFCLPNIILGASGVEGFVDLGGAGVGDKHYDLFWGMWTLNYNLQTNKYASVFLEAYGLDNIDPVALKVAGILAALTEY